MSVGTVKWFDLNRGFGFIIGDDGHDVFVHFTAIECANTKFRRFAEGEMVEYEAEPGLNWLKAYKARSLGCLDANVATQRALFPRAVGHPNGHGIGAYVPEVPAILRKRQNRKRSRGKKRAMFNSQRSTSPVERGGFFNR